MTMKLMKKELMELLDIYGISGEETNVRSYIKPILKGLMDSIEIDYYGNLLGTKICGDGSGAVIMLSAHMDTVRGVDKNKIVVEKDGIISAILPDGQKAILGADDRAGIAIVLTALRNIPETFNGVIKVCFSREEEAGCIGAGKVSESFYEDVDLAIIVDRRGSSDIVVGCGDAFCSNEVGYFFEEVSEMAELDFECTEGGISDAYVFSSAGINSVNLSAGYENEHTNREFLVFDDMKGTVKLIIQAIAIINSFYPKFGEVPQNNKWVLMYNKYYYANENVLDYGDDFLYLEPENELCEVMVFKELDEIVIEQGGNQVILTKNQLDEIIKQFGKSKKAFHK